jgi:NAD(P)-dependent dehydrogenase (short-subunit alcohol dehydrogenase family)
MSGILDGKIAIVTGGTSGIGAATAELFAAEGARVVISGRRQAEGEALAEKIGARFVRADVSVEADVEALVADTLATYGRLDVLVNSAGDPGPGGSIADVDFERFRQTLDVHLGGALLTMKHASRPMLEQGFGSIITVTSIAGTRAGWTGLGYAAAKAAAIHLTRSAAVELGLRGIRVNSVSPGPILTGIFGKGVGLDQAAADAQAELLEPVFLGVLENHQPIRRVGRPLDVARAALWLASDDSAMVTGQDVAVDGGILAGRPINVAAAERAAMAAALTS